MVMTTKGAKSARLKKGLGALPRLQVPDTCERFFPPTSRIGGGTPQPWGIAAEIGNCREDLRPKRPVVGAIFE